jgi:two-component system, NarL family, response regulator LiaR
MGHIRVLLVDDHEAARRSLRSILSSSAKIKVVAESADDEMAVKSAAELRPDIVLLDISLPGISGIEAARRIRDVSPESRIIFVSQHDSTQMARDVLRSGAYGYVIKSDAGRDLVSAIESVIEGRTFVSPTLVDRDPT